MYLRTRTPIADTALKATPHNSRENTFYSLKSPKILQTRIFGLFDVGG